MAVELGTGVPLHDVHAVGWVRFLMSGPQHVLELSRTRGSFELLFNVVMLDALEVRGFSWLSAFSPFRGLPSRHPVLSLGSQYYVHS